MHKNEKLLIVGVTVCLLIGVVGYSFAYFLTGLVVSGSGNENSGSTARLINVEYNAGTSALTLEDALPGQSASKEFTVNITPTADEKTVKYGISLKIDSNSFEKCTTENRNEINNNCTLDANEVVVTLKRKIDGGAVETLVTNKDITTSTGSILIRTEDLSFTDTNTHEYTYTLEVTFVDTNADQNHNFTESLTGSVNVAFVE